MAKCNSIVYFLQAGVHSNLTDTYRSSASPCWTSIVRKIGFHAVSCTSGYPCRIFSPIHTLHYIYRRAPSYYWITVAVYCRRSQILHYICRWAPPYYWIILLDIFTAETRLRISTAGFDYVTTYCCGTFSLLQYFSTSTVGLNHINGC